MDLQHRIGQYMGVTHVHYKEVNTIKYTIFIYSAYNAMGLIGTECNGIGIVDDTNRRVVTDGIASEYSGYIQPSAKTYREYQRIKALEGPDFLDFLANTDNYRGAYLKAV